MNVVSDCQFWVNYGYLRYRLALFVHKRAKNVRAREVFSSRWRLMVVVYAIYPGCWLMVIKW